MRRSDLSSCLIAGLKDVPQESQTSRRNRGRGCWGGGTGALVGWADLVRPFFHRWGFGRQFRWLVGESETVAGDSLAGSCLFGLSILAPFLLSFLAQAQLLPAMPSALTLAGTRYSKVRRVLTSNGNLHPGERYLD